MDVVKSGNKVLFIWGGNVNDQFETTINDLKAIPGTTISVENIERLKMGMLLIPCHTALNNHE